MFSELELRIAAIENAQKNTVRVGKVSAVSEETGMVRVAFADCYSKQGYQASAWLPVLVKQSKATKDFYMPDVDEHVLCLFIPGATENGFVLGSHYSSVDAPPAGSAGKRVVRFEDGTEIAYDKVSKTLSVAGQGPLSIQAAGPVTVQSDGDVQVQAGGAATVSAQGSATVEASEVKLGAASASGGVVTTQCLCSFTGGMHPMGSSKVLASKE